MNAGEVLFAILSEDAGVSGVVDNRIYPVAAPQNSAFPKIVYTLDLQPVQHKDAASDTDIVTAQLDLWGANYDVLFDLSNRVREALDHTGGTWGGQNGRMHVSGQETGRDDESEYFRIGMTVRMMLRDN